MKDLVDAVAHFAHGEPLFLCLIYFYQEFVSNSVCNGIKENKKKGNERKIKIKIKDRISFNL
jgi:hypothetical protein